MKKKIRLTKRIPVICLAILLTLVVGILPASASSQQVKLTASDGAANDNFGFSVSLHGETALAGARDDDYKGSAYVFVPGDNSTWTEQAKLTASDGANDDDFGKAVAVYGDTALIGAQYDDDKGTSSGSVYVFVRGGTTWTQQAKLTASDGAPYDWFGWSVALDEDTAVIGATGDDDKGAGSGSVYVFVRDGITWTQQAKLTANDGAPSDFFGNSVALDVDTAIIGAHSNDDRGTDSGSAYVFMRSDTTWTEQAKLTASDGAANDYFGRSVSIDVETALVGASGSNNTGAAYVFMRGGTTWTEQAKLIASDGASGDNFGYSVSLDGETALVGAYQDDDKGSGSGSAYVYELSITLFLNNLINQVTALDIPQGTENSLTAKLSVALKAIEDSKPNNDGAAINAMENFIKFVETQRDKKITNEDADMLIDKALVIITQLGGST